MSTSLALILCHLQLQDRAALQRALLRAPMDQGMELKGCVCRIKSSALELLSMEEDLTADLDDELWDLVRRDLQLKATFLYIDLNRVIACNECEERREEITLLGNDFFHSMDELADAVANRSVSVVKLCYGDAAQALREVVAAVVPPAAAGCSDVLATSHRLSSSLVSASSGRMTKMREKACLKKLL